MSAGRVCTAASLLRDRAEAARSLDWEAAKDLESIGFSDSGVALVVADLLDDGAGYIDWVSEHHPNEEETKGALYVAVADAILGDAS